jgi:hypothetical protein
MDPALVKALAQVALPPLVLGAIVALAAWWRSGRVSAPSGDGTGANTATLARGAARAHYWAIPVFGVVAYLVLHPIALARVPWPMTSAQDRPIVAALVALVLAALATRVRFPPLVRWIVRAIATGGVGALITWTWLSTRWSPLESATTLGGWLAATLLTWWALETLLHARPDGTKTTSTPHSPAQERARAMGSALVASAVAGAAAIALTIGYNTLSIGQLAGILATYMLGVAFAAALRPRISLAFGTAHVVTLITQALLLAGIVTTSTPWERAYPWLIALVAVAGLGARLVVDRRAMPAWAKGGIVVAAAALVVAAAGGLAVANMPVSDY